MRLKLADRAPAKSEAVSTPTLIDVRGLKKYFPLRSGLDFWRPPPVVRAVDDVSFSIPEGTTYGLVGESGSGKTTIARNILLLERATAGDVLYRGMSIFGFRASIRARYRADVQAVFQNPHASLNPRMRVKDIIAELLMLHTELPSVERRERVNDLLELVGLSPTYGERFPHEFSGGQQQRIAVARAIATTPKLVILDEPVSALDVSIRAQVLNLLADLQERFHLSYLLIAHDVATVQRVTDVVGVLYLGKMMEECSSEDLTANPLHPYTQALLSAVPTPDPSRRKEAAPITGEIESALHPPSGCRFHTRCPLAFDRCSVEEPALIQVKPCHRVACHLVVGAPIATDLH